METESSSAAANRSSTSFPSGSNSNVNVNSNSDNKSNKKARLNIEDDNKQELLFDDSSFQSRFATIRQWVAQPIDASRDEDGVFRDPFPASIIININSNTNTNTNVMEDTGVLIGNKYHASDVDNLVKLGVTAVLNCASGGISRLPVDELREKGIRYGFTNVRQDDLKYPILHELTDFHRRNSISNSNNNSNSNNSNITGMDDSENTTDQDNRSSTSSSLLPPPNLRASQHLKAAKAMYIEEVLKKKGKLMFFCVAGQNRSTTLALATLLLRGKPEYVMDSLCESLSKTRPFVLENEGFQQQLLELERYLKPSVRKKKKYAEQKLTMYAHGDYTHEDWIASQTNPSYNMIASATTTSYDTADSNSETGGASTTRSRSQSIESSLFGAAPVLDNREFVEIELLIPGLCTMEAFIPVPSSISEVKKRLINHVNTNLLNSEDKEVAKSWIVLAAFGKDDSYDLPLEEEAIERSVQLERLSKMFQLKIEDSEDDNDSSNNRKLVYWNSKCRFALVIFSVYCDHESKEKDRSAEQPQQSEIRRKQEPWTFVHRERPGAPSTLLNNTLNNTRLRAWDFCDGQAFSSKEPIVFSFSEDPRDKRQFMKISTCSQKAQQFHAPGEGGILGMGSNAIVHRVELKSTSPKSFDADADVAVDDSNNDEGNEEWDAAVKRPFSLSKMLASLESSSEAGLGKRLRQLAHTSLLNSDGRVLYFYGLGVALSSNAYRPTEYKFEATILARYEEEFSTYTMKRFMQDYTSKTSSPLQATDDNSSDNDDWRKDFSLISVKVLLVSLLNAFRDLTLMGVQAFDFNHLGNVLVSRDHQSVKLLDIDGDSRGSIPLSEYVDESSLPPPQPSPSSSLLPLSSISKPPKLVVLHKPSLDVDLNAVLPTVVQQLLLGKGRGTSFVVNTKSSIWRLPPDKAKALIEETVSENFGPLTESHMAKVVEWFYAMLKKQPPWGNWTHDIYDAMRCIDHLPIR